MRRGGLDLPPMGGEGKIVEADETYYGQIPEDEAPHDARPLAVHSSKHGGGANGSSELWSRLVERGGEVRSFHVPAAHR